MSATSVGEDPAVSRRALLAGGTVAAGAAIAAGADRAQAASGAKYPRHRVIALSKLHVNRPVDFKYPLADQPNVLLDLGHEVPGGVGSKRSIVAFSTLCQHMGCPVSYSAAEREFICPCHQSGYDYAGRVVRGPAPRNLPVPPHRFASPTRIVIGEEPTPT